MKNALAGRDVRPWLEDERRLGVRLDRGIGEGEREILVGRPELRQICKMRTAPDWPGALLTEEWSQFDTSTISLKDAPMLTEERVYRDITVSAYPPRAKGPTSNRRRAA